MLFAAMHESAIGTKRTCARALQMSAFGGKADIAFECVCGGPAVATTGRWNELFRQNNSDESATVQIGAFGNVAPIHDRRAELLITRVNLLGEDIAGTSLCDHVFADPVEGL
jgi:hypothetical protein